MELVRLHCEPTTFQVRRGVGALVDAASSTRADRGAVTQVTQNRSHHSRWQSNEQAKTSGLPAWAGYSGPSSGAQVVRGAMRGLDNKQAPGR